MRNTVKTLANIGFAAALMLCLQAGAHASDTNTKVPCTAPTGEAKLERTLIRTAERLRAHQPITIIAIGSSSTAGAGASSPAASYPNRLEAELRLRFPDEKITVINHGVNGEVGSDMLARFEHDVIDEKPDLVLWQVGSNSVLRDHPLGPAGEVMRDGIKMLKKIGIDVVLIDPQYAPKILTKHDFNGMNALIEVTAKETSVAVFHRFSIMRYWHETRDLPFETFITPDGLHMNDWGYDCWAKLLGASIAEAATRPTPHAITSASMAPGLLQAKVAVPAR
jgi:acyl-CoA thioesterase-1